MGGKFTQFIFLVLVMLGAAVGARGQCSVYPAGLSGLQVVSAGDTSVTFSWTSAAPGQSYSITVTNDSTNSNLNNFTYYTADVTDTFFSQGLLAPFTHYFIFVNADGCSPTTDSISFTTRPYCIGHSDSPAVGIIPTATLCQGNYLASFGMGNPNVYQEYTFLQNGHKISPTYTNMPGSQPSGTVSYPLPDTKDAVGRYQVLTFYPGCRDTVYGNIQYYYYAGMVDVTVKSIAGGAVRVSWTGVPANGVDSTGVDQYNWAVTNDSLTPANTSATPDTSVVITGLQPGQTYYFQVNNAAIASCSNYYYIVPFIASGCGVAAPFVSLSGGVCASANTGLIVGGLSSGEKFTFYKNGQPMSNYTRIDSATAQAGYTFQAADTGAFYVMAYDSCGDSVSSDTVYNYNAGLYGLILMNVGDTLVSFRFNAAVAGDTFTYDITTDPTNTDFNQVVDQLHVTNLSDTAGQLQINTKYYLFIGDSACFGPTDSVSFTTTPYSCSHQLQPQATPTALICEPGNGFGMPVTNPYQEYTFLHNGKPVATYPGSSTEPVSYPVPNDQSASGFYQVITYFPNCPTIDSGNVQYWWFGGVGDLTISSPTDTSVYLSWMTSQKQSQYQWGIGTDSLNLPSTFDTTSDTSVFIGGLTPNTKYYVYVNNMLTNCQTQYDTLSFITPAATAPPCGLSGLTTTHVDSTQVSFHWTSVAPGQTYQYVITTDSTNSQPNLVAGQGTAIDTFAIATGLTAGTVYYLFVDDQACSTSFDRVTFTTAQESSGTSPCSPGTVPVPGIRSAIGRFKTCGDSSLLLTSTAATGNQWFANGNLLPDSTRASLVVTQSGNYSVSFTDSVGCADTSAIQQVTISPNPALPVIDSSGSLTFCAGDSVILTSSGPSGNQWYQGSNTLSGDTGISYTASASGSYSVRTTNTGGCWAQSMSLMVTVLPVGSGNQVPVISPADSIMSCTDSVYLAASGASSYQWFVDGGILSGQYADTLIVTQPGSYTVAANGSTCSASSGQSIPVVVTFVSSINPMITYANGELASNYTEGNQWYLNGSAIQGAIGQDLTPLTPGSYSVRIEVNNQVGDTCYSAFSAVYTLADSSFTVPDVSVFPNPVISQLTLENHRVFPATVRIFDLTGRQVTTIGGLFGTVQVNVSGWSSGVYMIEIIDQATHKVVHVEVLKQ